VRYGFRFEPAIWLGVARTLIYTAGLFGWWGVDQWTVEQKVGMVGLIETVSGALQRSIVTPNAKLTTATVEAAKDVPPNDPV